jgi:hypothetical protein
MLHLKIVSRLTIYREMTAVYPGYILKPIKILWKCNLFKCIETSINRRMVQVPACHRGNYIITM